MRAALSLPVSLPQQQAEDQERELESHDCCSRDFQHQLERTLEIVTSVFRKQFIKTVSSSRGWSQIPEASAETSLPLSQTAEGLGWEVRLAGTEGSCPEREME